MLDTPPHKTTRPGIPASAAGGGESLVCFIGGLHRNLLIEWHRRAGERASDSDRDGAAVVLIRARAPLPPDAAQRQIWGLA